MLPVCPLSLTLHQTCTADLLCLSSILNTLSTIRCLMATLVMVNACGQALSLLIPFLLDTVLSRSAWCCLTGLEKASCALVEMCLANPQYFYVTEVLGPACIAIAEAKDNALALTCEYCWTQNGKCLRNSLGWCAEQVCIQLQPSVV